MKNRPFVITISAFGLLAVLLIGGYFALWRPSDSSYTTADQQLDELSTSAFMVNQALKAATQTAYVSEALVKQIETSSNDYSASLKSLSTNAAITRDQSVKTAYQQHSDALTAFGHSASDLVTSMKKYRALLGACTALVGKVKTITTASAFDIASIDCKDAVEAAKSVPSNSFSDQFLGDYAEQATDLLDAYRQQAAAGQVSGLKTSAATNLTSVNQRIETLSQKTLDLKLSDPTSVIKSLQDKITSQKAQLLR